MHSIIGYGIFSGNLPYSIKIFKIQKKIIRVNNLRNRDSCRDMFKTMKILLFYSQYIFSLLTYIANNRHLFIINQEMHNINVMNGWPPSITGVVDFRILFILQVVVAASMEISIVAECMRDAERYTTCFTGVARISGLSRAKTSYDGLQSGISLDILTYAQIWEFVATWFSLVYGIRIRQFDLCKPVMTDATGSLYRGVQTMPRCLCRKSLHLQTTVDYLLVCSLSWFWNFCEIISFVCGKYRWVIIWKLLYSGN
jgi:hypothetical protein